MAFDDSKLSDEDKRLVRINLSWAAQTILHAIAIRNIINDGSTFAGSQSALGVADAERTAREFLDAVADKDSQNAPFAKLMLFFAKKVIAESYDQMNLTSL